MRSASTWFLLLLFPVSSFCQKEFFRSTQSLDSSRLANFYSSVSIHDGILLFLANDYTMYAYDRSSAQQKWAVYTGYKTNQAPCVSGKKLFTGIYEDRSEIAAMFDVETGTRVRTLPFGTLGSTPLIKDGVLFATALYDGGCLLAYDIARDSVLWHRFLAHGFSEQPYFFGNYIHANAESNNWVKVTYDGKLMDTTCAVKADIFVSDIPCISNFYALTHDRYEIRGKVADKILGVDHDGIVPTSRSANHTFILKDGKLTVIGNALKILQQVEVSTLLTNQPGEFVQPATIVAADDVKVNLLYADQYIIYDHKKKRVKKIIDLTAWKPHQVIIDKNRLWLVSRSNGLLYGLAMD
jgi:hypothetical protein